MPLLCGAQKQHVAYTYDASGNRIRRIIVLDSSKKIQRQSTTSVDENIPVVGTFGVMIYPNPVADNLTIALKGEHYGNAEYYLYDSTGKKLTEGKITDEKTNINMAYCASGMYVLNISTGKESTSWKILKK